MAQISSKDGNRLAGALRHARTRMAQGLRWWAEHQAWPANEDVRIERERRF